jgi:hypothetical protein
VLTQYINLTQRLLQNPAAPNQLYSPADLTTYINIARGQIAAEGECIRRLMIASTVIGQRPYAFSVLAFQGGLLPNVTGVEGVIHVRRLNYAIGLTGFVWIKPLAWPWFDFYHLSNPVPGSGAPTVWSQYAQGASGQGTGSAVGGSFFLDPLPDNVYQLQADCVCYPQPLAADTDVEALPYLWTDAVPFYAAYYALLGAQASARQQDALRMFQLYQQYMQRARSGATPAVDGYLYAQAPDPVQAAKLGGAGGRPGAAQPGAG